ncbi:SPASM domain-containing protein [Maridesulfovibrio frigidus]|uniref:SPASM domain-containing protein n=1 Tax=Maridesulfovibrio frigidus TaxID=340956 RepID=UPI0004E1BECC|nr:SPASM domain-containing protein [Maridesulfovibrio frigidus]
MKTIFKKDFYTFIVRHSAFEKISYILKSKHAFSKILNIALAKLNTKIQYTGYLPYYPTQISIEPTTACNYKCPSCCHGTPEGKAHIGKRDKHVDLVKYKKLIDDIHKKTWYLSLTGCGEDFFHPQIFDIIDYAADKGMFVTLETNGSVLDPQKLADSNISHIHFALDCTTQEAYAIYRIGGNIENVLERMLKFCELNTKKDNPIKLHIRVLVNKFTEGDFAHAKSLFSKYDFVNIYQDCFTIPPKDFKMLSTLPYTTTVENYDEWKPVINTEYDTYKLDPVSGLMKNEAIFKEFTGKCPGVYSGAFVNSEGAMTPCCEAYTFVPEKLYYGNVFEEGFDAVWNGKKARTFRTNFKKTKGDYALCKNCPNSRM